MTQFFNFDDGRGLVPFKLHPNGGGRVADTAIVDPTAHIGACCMVFGFAQVKGNAVITGRVRIDGDRFPNGVSTVIEDGARIAGSVHISGNALIRDSADIRDEVRIEGCVVVMHRARLAGRARLSGWVRAMDSCYLAGDVALEGSAEALEIRGEATLLGGRFTKASEVASAIRRDQALLDGGGARRRTAKQC